MVIALLGDSCTGKSSIAKKLSAHLSAEVYSGKDYLRLAKSESMAAMLFRKKLRGDKTILYVISEKRAACFAAGFLHPRADHRLPGHHQNTLFRTDARQSSRPRGRYAGTKIRAI